MMQPQDRSSLFLLLIAFSLSVISRKNLPASDWSQVGVDDGTYRRVYLWRRFLPACPPSVRPHSLLARSALWSGEPRNLQVQVGKDTEGTARVSPYLLCTNIMRCFYSSLQHDDGTRPR